MSKKEDEAQMLMTHKDWTMQVGVQVWLCA